MAERKAVNKYYPPDWDPSKGSINNYVGQHPLRDRAKKLGQGILVIRFELPYNIWCGGCGAHVGMGVRYNAEKSKTGMYYSTPIYKFRMKCHLCDNYFEIQTDPKNHDYVILEGARRKEQRWDPKENGQIETTDKTIQKKMATDAMFKLEHGSDDVKKGLKGKSNLTSLESRRDEWRDDYMLNKLARHKFREEKKVLKADAESDAALLAKSSLEIPLQAESERDIKLASLIKYRAIDSYDERQSKKRKEIESRPIFQPNKLARTDSNSPAVDKKLTIIRNTIKTAKKSTSPFDRMKMNTLSGNSLAKRKFGIKKKCIPSSAVFDLKSSTTTCSSNQTKQYFKDSNHNTTEDGLTNSEMPDDPSCIEIQHTNCIQSVLETSPSNDFIPVSKSCHTSSKKCDLINIKTCTEQGNHGESYDRQNEIEIEQENNRCDIEELQTNQINLNEGENKDSSIHEEKSEIQSLNCSKSCENELFASVHEGESRNAKCNKDDNSKNMKIDKTYAVKESNESVLDCVAQGENKHGNLDKTVDNSVMNKQAVVSLVAAYSDSDSDRDSIIT